MLPDPASLVKIILRLESTGYFKIIVISVIKIIMIMTIKMTTVTKKANKSVA